jgi:hypothetical protein
MRQPNGNPQMDTILGVNGPRGFGPSGPRPDKMIPICRTIQGAVDKAPRQKSTRFFRDVKKRTTAVALPVVRVAPEQEGRSG